MNLIDTLEAARARYRERNPASERQLAEAATVMPGGNTRSVLFHAPFPLTMVRGEGARLWDADGHRYLDALGEFTAGLYGHSNAVIRQAIIDALADGLSLSSHNRREVALAAEIQRRFPSMALMRFTNSGTEASLLALATAKAFTARPKIMVFDGAYHGGLLSFGRGGSPINVPHAYVVAPYNDLAAAQALVHAHGPTLAAIVVEPMLGAGGCIPGEPAFLRGLSELARGCGALLVFDEVQTSRLSIGGRQAQLGITPDLTVIGKYFGGGLSFGAFGGRVDCMAQFDPRRANALSHAGTFNNNVLSMAAGLAGLQQVLTQEALAALNQRGDRLRERLNAVLQTHGVAAQFTGLGSVMNLHGMTGPVRCAADLATSNTWLKELLFFDLLERGVYMAQRGLVSLSLPFDESACEEMLGAFEDVVRARRDVLRG
ncbi:aminotransferase class III-fold pyridoxal phosphate-dependent enzyme [Hydrogenophaga sp. D2P1]|uniref:Aminotransferase class III-fold pyridoxal phosphate-dependent enzyme n=1 Tax=Hydrogenophaga aromaticivorans TaxID=2610898 RepID=A0A7Y8GX52_9BURK|nr:aminotransferase class III-fold pyridoxal phosphate-dependent enzyme [Hydrogenophaga aromaticivorans]NWF46462.1 aminotransferase class III-fold pyridoxal phosphate-dependent enzyme [Hydrogenophaga aromaticivorans]